MPSLSQFFESSAAVTVRGRPITFRAIRRTVDPVDDSKSATVASDVRALLWFVDESARAEAHKAADEYINAKYKTDPPSPEARDDERIFRVLALALRDTDPPHAPLVRTADELRSALTLPVVRDLWAEYQRYLSEEFPAYVDQAEFARLVEDAKKKPLPDLRGSFDSDFVRRCMPGLVALLLPSGTRK